MISLTKPLTSRSFGIEIEMYSKVSEEHVSRLLNEAGIACQVEGYNHSTRPHWKIVSDGSIDYRRGWHSFELVSPVLSGEEGLLQIRQVCAILNGPIVQATINKSCGLHVHHGASDFGVKQLRNVVNLYKNHEAEMDEMVPPSRRRSNAYYCNTLQHIDAGQLFRTSRHHRTPQLGLNSRYYKVNMAAFQRHSTVEIRHFGGTTDADKICGWVCLTQALVERAASSKKSIRKPTNARHNIFWAFHLLGGNQTIMACSPAKQVEMKAIYKDIRKWVKQRKKQLAA